MSTFMNMSFTAAVMIVAIIVIRSLVINKLPKKTFMVLWGGCIQTTDSLFFAVTI